MHEKDIIGLKSFLEESFPSKTELNIKEFQDIFSEEVDEWELLFTMLKTDKGHADPYQAMAIIIFYSGCMFEEKLKRNPIIRNLYML